MGLYERDYGREDEMSPWDRHQRSQQPKSMTIILVVITVAIYFIDMFTGEQLGPGDRQSRLLPWFGCWSETLLRPWQWYQFLTYGFLHDQNSLMHVGFNMFGLWVFGRNVEQRMGRWEFLRFYLVSMFVGGVAGCLTYWAMGIDNGVVIGASGAVIAVTIMFACYYPQATILLMFVIPVKAWVVAVIFVVTNLYGSLTMLSGQAAQGGTAFTVHLAGVAFALLYYFQHWNLNWLDFSDSGRTFRQSIRRTKLKIHDPDQKLRQENEEVDQILAKIHASGEQSLTRSERRVLERHSRRQREKRNLD
ncbi:rhomboid family intramembrane serine protease [Stieleria sp. TO1_6]|uniref:rhomboid family intramembrane serine protease n=1 Tax=Stieleria tagensis TaxID=2956795 RepID=UPI00209AB4A0|nr:rhomboid family intramembrane serine protease [Stieleria tagensis]MCO8124602.1 rhomboid family intramembrane serine protease [Stieleria tagensis]